MRDFVSFFVNGEKQEVRARDAFMTLSDFLRTRLGLVGTKIVCSEGDCGSCTVLCGFPDSSSRTFQYRSLDSCIRFVFQLDGVHIVTVEGLVERTSENLGEDSIALTGVQQSMIDCHGSQCGFCTPGFVMAMTGMLQDKNELSTEEVRHGLTGNLCRCTGYSPIIDAAQQVEVERCANLNEKYPAEDLFNQLGGASEQAISIATPEVDGMTPAMHVFCPTTVAGALDLLAKQPTAKIVAGATDLGVQFNKGRLNATTFVDLNRVTELTDISNDGKRIVCGARVTWAKLESVVAERAPQFKEIISVFGSPQIRHAGTIGGNLINASPIADSIPFLYVCEAMLTLVSAVGERTVNINDFYTGYKQFDLQPDELLAKIEFELPDEMNNLRLYKITRRRDMDISTFTAAIYLETSNDQIRNAKIAYGAVGPTVVRMEKTETFLVDKPFSLETIRQAGNIAVEEITPLTDVRGSANYRLSLARNVLLKYFHETKSTASV
jgi:xanthine dehydrogenase small subunit